ncbi:MAG TPA: glycosyltransferase [Candidatus Limnocylindrales bacterium]|jgi:glycosyltransferase involved in cell wall biosynthesis
MYVFNDCTTDARVLREATSLAAAGHEVTVIARLDDPAMPSRDRRDGFEIRRIPVPVGPQTAWAFFRHPWRARRRLAGLWQAAIRRGAAGLPLLALVIVGGLATALWSAVLAPIAWVGGALARAAGRPERPGSDLIDWLVAWRWRTLGWARAAATIAPDADVHHGHDLSGLPAAIFSASGRSRVVYDSHEIFLESGSNATRPSWVRRRFAAIEQGWIRHATAIVTVNDALAGELAHRYRTPRIVTVHNCAPRWTPPAVPEDRIRRAIGLAPEAIVALYHGAFRAHRGLEQLAEAILEPGLEQVHAVYLGYGPERPRLDALAADPRFAGRVHVLGGVDPAAVVSWVAGADVAVMAIQPSTLNHVLSTPNKLFEAIAAGTPVVASDFPEIRKIVAADGRGSLGELCDPADPRSVAAAIRAIIGLTGAEREALRQRCLAAAHDRWNWETEASALVKLYDDLAGAEDASGGRSD